MAATPRPDSFELADYLGVLRRRWWIVLLLVLVGAVAGAGYAKLAPKAYTAGVLIQVNQLPNNTNSVAGRTSGSVNMDNQSQIVQSDTVAALAARQFRTTLSPVDLAQKISVSVPANTTFLQVKCTLASPEAAAACANAFGRAYLTNGRTSAAAGISGQLASQTRRISQLASRIAALKAQLAGLSSTSTQHVKDQLTLTADQGLLAELTASNNKLIPLLASLELPNNTAIGQVVTPATAPTSPSSPKVLLVLPSGVVIGLLLGLLAAFFADFRDRRIHAARDVERFLDLPVLVNLAAGKARLALALAPPRSRAGQAFTELGQYIAASLGEGSHVIFVAGTSVGPGCSLLAANLAATLARTRSEVVLVCADPHGTVTPQLLGISDGRGLAEVLSGSATAAEVIRRPADERRLRVITPGVDTSGVLLHLQYEASRRLLSELRRDARYVIVEVQSVGEDSDAFALAEFADIAVMAVETSQTTRSGAADCLQRLDRLRTSVLGAVVLPAPGSRRPVSPPRIDTPRLDAARADTTRLDAVRADAAWPDTPRTSTARPAEAPRPGTSLPDSPRSEIHRSEIYRSESYRPESHRADGRRADSRRASSRPARPASPAADDRRRPSGAAADPAEAGRSGRTRSAETRPEPGTQANRGGDGAGQTSSSGSSLTGRLSTPARAATETRPLPRVKPSGPAEDPDDRIAYPVDELPAFPDPADKTAGA
jgi:capsular polysaccharide biosynthesis protein/Mrp family chromosome partitioning ATPase